VAAEDFVVENSGDGETVEAVRECLPQFDRESTLAFVVEPVDSVNGGAFVIATEKKEVLRVLDFVSKEKTDRLDRLLSTINVVTHEEVVGLWWESSVFEEAEEIGELAVNITANLQRSLQLQQDRLGQEDVAGSKAESPDFGLGHLNRFARAASSDLEESGNERVNVQLGIVARHC